MEPARGTGETQTEAWRSGPAQLHPQRAAPGGAPSAIILSFQEDVGAALSPSALITDEYNSSVLGDEVLAIEMGTVIQNLTDTINVNFWNSKYDGVPSCHSWNGTGGRPQWTSYGCETIQSGINVTCKCSHMTFFAVLLTPLNETISSSDLNTLTTLTRIGCGISMFFLAIVVFLHFVMRSYE
uniref:GAIN-B domain-containing protein n=1 Tax=Knipowitschia caucasica TaxID=637954 RepID=A0AAV2KBI7_KNICA